MDRCAGEGLSLGVNRSVTWADWDDELLSLELQELAAADFDLSLTGFDPRELEDLLTLPDNHEQADVAPSLPENPVSRLGDLWLCGNRRNQHRILCGDATSPDAVTRLLGDRKPFLMITDPPDGIELDSEWRDRAGLNGCGPAQASYMKHRTEGQTETTISGDTRADWSEAFALVPSLQIALRLARQRSYARGSGWPPADRISASPANNLGQTAHGSDADALLVPT
jgi:hypothetical protein